jgi:hypothetical protein
MDSLNKIHMAAQELENWNRQIVDIEAEKGSKGVYLYNKVEQRLEIRQINGIRDQIMLWLELLFSSELTANKGVIASKISEWEDEVAGAVNELEDAYQHRYENIETKANFIREYFKVRQDLKTMITVLDTQHRSLEALGWPKDDTKYVQLREKYEGYEKALKSILRGNIATATVQKDNPEGVQAKMELVLLRSVGKDNKQFLAVCKEIDPQFTMRTEDLAAVWKKYVNDIANVVAEVESEGSLEKLEVLLKHYEYLHRLATRLEVVDKQQQDQLKHVIDNKVAQLTSAAGKERENMSSLQQAQDQRNISLQKQEGQDRKNIGQQQKILTELQSINIDEMNTLAYQNGSTVVITPEDLTSDFKTLDQKLTTMRIDFERNIQEMEVQISEKAVYLQKFEKVLSEQVPKELTIAELEIERREKLKYANVEGAHAALVKEVEAGKKHVKELNRILINLDRYRLLNQKQAQSHVEKQEMKKEITQAEAVIQSSRKAIEHLEMIVSTLQKLSISRSA